MHFNHLSCISTCELYLLLFSCCVVYNSFWPHGLQRARLLCPSLSPGVCSHSCPSSRWCHPTISSTVIPFSSCPQSFPASGSFPMSQHFPSGGQSIGASASASVLPVNIQGWVCILLLFYRWGDGGLSPVPTITLASYLLEHHMNSEWADSKAWSSHHQAKALLIVNAEGFCRVNRSVSPGPQRRWTSEVEGKANIF